MMTKTEIKEAIERLSGKEIRAITKVYIYEKRTDVCTRHYSLTDDQWQTLKTSLEVREVYFEETTKDSIIIIINKRGEGA